MNYKLVNSATTRIFMEGSNKSILINECRRLKRIQKAGNNLRISEGSKERDYSKYEIIDNNEKVVF